MSRDAGSSTGSTLLVLLNSPADVAAWSAFERRYGPKIHDWCRRRGVQEADAQDVSQEVLATLVRKLPEFAYDPAKGTFRGWLRTVTLNALSHYLQAQRRPGQASGHPADLDALASVEAHEDLLHHLRESFDHELLAEAQARVRRQVSPRDWRIFVELAVEGRSGREVAEPLGMTVGAVLMAKARVQDRLRKEVRRLEGEET
jgi:RNA polymerase sigma-70 factor (ECF subfamily)